MSETELTLPPFLEEDEDDIHERMLEAIPSEYDDREGSLVHDLTKPTALEVAKLLEFDLPLIIQSMFPQFAEGIYLDYHGRKESVVRRAAVAAVGTITIEGAEGTFIPAGTTVTTDEVDGVSIEYSTTNDVTIGPSGIVRVGVEALEAGELSNIPRDSINNFLEPVVGVSSVYNESAISGGIDEEEDDIYRERILATNRTRSSTGNRADYVRWAKEIAGVGEVFVTPEWNGPGTVKMSIASSSGTAPSQAVIDAVQNYIAPDGRDGGGMAPIGALVTVDSINSRIINVSFAVTLGDGYENSEVIEWVKDKTSEYLSEELKQGDLVRLTKVGAIIANAPGVIDYQNLRINDIAENLQLNLDEAAVMGEVKIV